MLYWLVIIPIIIAVINIGFIHSDSRKLIVGSQIGITLYTTYLFFNVRSQGTIINNMAGYPRAFSITLYADRISIVLVWLTTLLFLGLLIYAYSGDYFDSQFGFLYLTLQALIIALFLSTDLFNIYVLLEVSTVVVAILIMLRKDRQAVYDGMIFLFISVIASSFWLFGVGFLYRTFGHLDLHAISEVITEVENPRSLILPFAFIMTTISLKIALFPLSSWLPKAYGTPSAPPVIPAILSGVYETTGLYLFIRLTAMFSQVIELNTFFLVIGFVTSIVGFTLAVAQNDLRLLLAYSTISQVGLMTVGFSFGAEASYWGAMYHMFAHSLFKTVLFLSVGVLSHHYKTRDIHKIRGVMKTLPVTGFAIIFGLLGITGAPLFNGSISKYMISYGSDSPYIQLLLNLINLGTLLYSMKFAAMLFGKNTQPDDIKGQDTRHDVPQWTTLTFGVLTLISGLFGNRLLQFLYGYDFTIYPGEYLEKSFIYLLLVLAAFALYKGWVKERDLFSKIGYIELSFNAMITALVAFFIGIVGYMYWLT
ncbi:complex I subunit 5 family protein [Alkalibacterium olivapovliticus]|uniref:Multicomponent Na+:H+ antiporter subunit D n=1 Tax=Alkalibacterium olivapovliticus TaxID=99907 RepID=A0A2T0W9E4_9LACT|nr:proton-conducting transporter membrane subunit [Alkalibacterium olivapovliticus]PRY83329.1 multicomponent Na+:H+ antiporter subunit D [Alkalibacterium olivapovliticus]